MLQQFSRAETVSSESPDDQWLYWITGCMMGCQCFLATLLAVAELWLFYRVRALYNGTAGNKLGDMKAEATQAAARAAVGV